MPKFYLYLERILMLLLVSGSLTALAQELIIKGKVTSLEDADGTFSSQASFFDYHRDGDLDMFPINHGNHFYTPFSICPFT